MKICFIGYGNLAKAIASSLRKNNQLQLFATAPSLPISLDANGISTHFDNTAFVNQADVIILAVKPKQIACVLTQINSLLPKKCLLLSVAAGVSLGKLASYCQPKQAIVRCMPNTPIAVKKGASAFIANDYVDEEQKNTIEILFKKVSILAWLDHEDAINAITALSGSGPAYVFLFLEAMIHAGETLGLSTSLAQSFVKQTVLGALNLVENSDLTLQDLRKKVTSKGGTTAAALAVLDEGEFSNLIFQAIKAAYDRSKEMNELN